MAEEGRAAGCEGGAIATGEQDSPRSLSAHSEASHLRLTLGDVRVKNRQPGMRPNLHDKGQITKERKKAINFSFLQPVSNTIPQYGVEPKQAYKNRVSAYAVVLNDDGKILVVNTGRTNHLPGGGMDEGEEPEAAAIRETLEEAGCVIENVVYLGRANQYFSETELGPLNKIGTFYTARLVSIDPSRKVEVDHEVLWMTPQEFLHSKAADFQKWAVQKALM